MYSEIEEKYPEPPDRDDKIHEAEIDKDLQEWVKEQKMWDRIHLKIYGGLYVSGKLVKIF